MPAELDPTPEDVELVGDALFTYLDRLGLDPAITRPYAAASAILAALASAGRLREPGDDEEWAWDNGAAIIPMHKDSARAVSAKGNGSAVRRWVGPWLPVEDTQPAPEENTQP